MVLLPLSPACPEVAQPPARQLEPPSIDPGCKAAQADCDLHLPSRQYVFKRLVAAELKQINDLHIHGIGAITFVELREKYGFAQEEINRGVWKRLTHGKKISAADIS